MKLRPTLSLLLFLSLNAFAETPCDVRMGNSSGVRVIEFATGNNIHSKMSVKDASADAIAEEMRNLQDMGVCLEGQQHAKKCILKYEKIKRANLITLHRGEDKWMTWMVKSKLAAQKFVSDLKRAGFCS